MVWYTKGTPRTTGMRPAIEKRIPGTKAQCSHVIKQVGVIPAGYLPEREGGREGAACMHAYVLARRQRSMEYMDR